MKSERIKRADISTLVTIGLNDFRHFMEECGTKPEKQKMAIRALCKHNLSFGSDPAGVFTLVRVGKNGPYGVSKRCTYINRKKGNGHVDKFNLKLGVVIAAFRALGISGFPEGETNGTIPKREKRTR